MKKGRKMTLRVIIELFFAVLVVHNAQGYSSLPPLKNYNENVTREDRHIKRILAFGDSLTEGYLNGGRKFYPYTTKLEEKLNAYFNWTRFEVLNEGISGECVFTEMVTRLPKVLDRIGDRIDLVIILGGTNDFHKLDCVKRINVAHEVLSLHKIVHKRGLRSVLVTIPECSSLGKKCDQTRVRVNDKLRGYATKHKGNTLLCDLGKYMPLHNMSSFDRKIYWDDEVHPSKIGYDKIAALLFHTIREWLMPPALNVTVPPPDDSDSKKVPDPDPINKLKKQKNSSQKKKESRDKKLAQALVSEANPAAANSSDYGNTATNQFSPANTQTITSLPSVSSSTPTSNAAEMALEATNLQYTNDKAAPPPKAKAKPHHKHKNKKLTNTAASQTTNRVPDYPPKQLPSSNTATNSYSAASNTASTNASPAAPPAPSPAAPNTTTSATSTANVAPPNTQSYTAPNSNTSNPYAQYYANNGTWNNNPNNTSPTTAADASSESSDLANQFPDYQASDNANTTNYTQTPASNNTSSQNTGYYSNNTTNTAINPNVKSNSQGDTNTASTPNSVNQGDIGDLQHQFPEFNFNEGK